MSLWAIFASLDLTFVARSSLSGGWERVPLHWKDPGEEFHLAERRMLASQRLRIVNVEL